MNPYLKNLKRLEFIITYSCTGRCKHCSESDYIKTDTHLTSKDAVNALDKINKIYPLDSVMTFGGEPLLYPDVVVSIHKLAKRLNIPKRQLITNGFFSSDNTSITNTAKLIATCGVNDILISADAFHQENIPLSSVLIFAENLLKNGAYSVKVHPAWLVGKDSDNAYNIKTKEIIKKFENLGIPSSNGNIVFPAGNALKYLSKYFDPNKTYINKYKQDPKDIRAGSISPNGDFINCNILDKTFINDLDEYSP